MSEAAAATKGERKGFWPGGVVNPHFAYSPALRAGPWVFIAGHMPTAFGPEGLAPECRPLPDIPHTHIPQRVQSAYVLANIDRVCKEAGASFDDHSVRIYQWFVAPDQDRAGGTWVGDGFTITPYLEERDRYLTHDRPPSTGMG